MSHGLHRWVNCFSDVFLGDTWTIGKISENLAGDKCEVNVDDCAYEPCENNGTCQDLANAFTCSCPEYFKGLKTLKFFSFKTMKTVVVCWCTYTKNILYMYVDCTNSHIWISCKDFFSVPGTTCNVTVDFCRTSPCLNNGTCHQELGGYNCTCPRGFRGTNCEINHDDCDSGPCQNGGSCEDGIATYR